MGGTLPVPNPVPLSVEEHKSSHIVTGSGFQNGAVGVGLPETQAAVMPCRASSALVLTHIQNASTPTSPLTCSQPTVLLKNGALKSLCYEWGLGAGVHGACVKAAGAESPGYVRILLCGAGEAKAVL